MAHLKLIRQCFGYDVHYYTLHRFSKIAAEKLTSGNPNIADLSDPNRPTKLGEIYSQLYDNEWTDALESLTQSGYEESEAIATLLDTLLVRFK